MNPEQYGLLYMKLNSLQAAVNLPAEVENPEPLYPISVLPGIDLVLNIIEWLDVH